MELKQEIGQRISETRKAMGMSLKSLSEKTGSFSAGRISNWEQGTRSPGPGEVKVLSKVLNVSPAYLLCLSDDVRGDLLVHPSILSRPIPVITLEELANNKAKKNNNKIDATNFKPGVAALSIEGELTKRASDHCYAVQIPDSSMEPDFYQNDFVIIDKERKPQPGEFIAVLIKKAKQILIRKYRCTGQTKGEIISYQLVASNRDWGVIDVSSQKEAVILGTVIEYRRWW